MNEKQKSLKKSDEPKDEKPDAPEKSNWAEDQQRRNYYYDDAHGYEIYNPEIEDDDEADD